MAVLVVDDDANRRVKHIGTQKGSNEVNHTQNAQTSGATHDAWSHLPYETRSRLLKWLDEPGRHDWLPLPPLFVSDF